MKAFHSFLIDFIIISLFYVIMTNPSYEDYSIVFLDKIHIGSQSKEITLIVNSLSSKTVLFTNSKRPYSQEIQRGRKSDVLIDKIIFAGQTIESFPFNLEIDDTKLNNAEIQGEFGLGINKDNSNDLIDILYNNQLISQKVLEFDIEEGKDKDKLTMHLNDKNRNEYTFCNLTSKKNMDEDDFYYEAWMCELSHLVVGSTKADLVWSKTKEVQGEIAIDTRTKYIYVPKEYMKYFSKFWDIDTSKCKLVHDINTDEKYYSCEKSEEERIYQMHSLYLIIGGYGYRLKTRDLFENDGKHLNCLIRFYNDEKNLWILGIPFLREYKTMLDYNKTRLGFSGEDVLNFKENYEKWAEQVAEKESELIYGYSGEKIIMIIGAIIGTLIILYVAFWLFRNCRREKPKYHIELNEQYDKKQFYQ